MKTIRIQEYKIEKLIRNKTIRHLYKHLRYQADTLELDRVEDETILIIKFKNGFTVLVSGDDEGYDTGFYIEEFKNDEMRKFFATMLDDEDVRFYIKRKETLLKWILKLGEL